MDDSSPGIDNPLQPEGRHRAAAGRGTVPPAGLANVGAEVHCRPNSFFFREFARQGHSPELLLDGIECSQARLCDRRERIDWETFRRLMTNLGRVWNDDELVEAGKRMTVSRWVQPFAAIARIGLTSGDVYRWTFRPGRGVSQQLFSCIRNDLAEPGPNRLIVRTRMEPGYRPSRELFLMFKGSQMAIPRLLGLREAIVEMEQVDDGVQYWIEYPPGGSVLSRLRRAVQWPLAARTAARELQEVSESLFERSGELASEASVRAKAERALVESESTFTKAFHAAPTLMSISSTDGRFLDVNKSFAEASGYAREQLIGRNVADLKLWKDSRVRDRMIDELRRGNSIRGVEVEFFSRSGERRVGLLSAEMIVLGGEPCVIWQALDVTDRKRAEEENRLLQERMLQAQKLESLGVMAGGIAHDFNNLLVGILGNAELALAELDAGEPQRERIEAILETSRQAAGLTQEMLAYGGKGKRSSTPIRVDALVGQTVLLSKSVLPANAVLDYSCAQEPLWIEGDDTQVRQIVMNMVINAAESYGETAGTVWVRIDSVTVGRTYPGDGYVPVELPPGDYARIVVRDSGCGMDERTLKKIFDPFFTTKFTGRGLGLAATLGIVSGHGGGIKVRSTPQGGTLFEVLLPRTPPAAATVEQPALSHGGPVTGPVLIIDDEPAVREVAGMMLTKAGYEAIQADGGKQAIELLRDRLDEIVAVVLDLSMPGMSGEATFEALRTLRPDLPVLCCSGHGDETGTRWIEDKSNAMFVAKPFSGERLRRRLGDLLRTAGPDPGS